MTAEGIEPTGKLEGAVFSLQRLKDYLPEGKLREIKSADVPASALNVLFRQCQAEGRFKSFFTFTDSREIQTYITSEEYLEKGKVGVGQRAYVVYMSGDNLVGYGYVSHYWDQTSDAEKRLPSPEPWIQEDYRGQGLGVRMYEILNACSQAWFDQPMFSSPRPSEDGEHNARRVWRRLVRDGKARFEHGLFVFNEKKSDAQ